MTKVKPIEDKPTYKGCLVRIVQDYGIVAAGRCIEDSDDGITVETEIEKKGYVITCYSPFIRQIWIEKEGA